jgi:hypothetical protein
VAAAAEVCESATPGFLSMSAAQQASCLCASTLRANTWTSAIPWGASTFDALIDQCSSYGATASPALATSMASIHGFCAKNYAAKVTGAAAGSGSTTVSTTARGSGSTSITTTARGSVITVPPTFKPPVSTVNPQTTPASNGAGYLKMNLLRVSHSSLHFFCSI